jgi:hypothetical protein
VSFAGDAEHALEDLESAIVELIFTLSDGSSIRLIWRYDPQGDPPATTEVAADAAEDRQAVGEVRFVWRGNLLEITFDEFSFPPGGGIHVMVTVREAGAVSDVVDGTPPAPCGAGTRTG